jgi:hypothetical protein
MMRQYCAIKDIRNRLGMLHEGDSGATAVGESIKKQSHQFNEQLHYLKRAFMKNIIAAVFIGLALTACGKGEEKKMDAAQQSAAAPIAQASSKVYGKNDGECFANIVKEFDAKKLNPAEMHIWRDKLSSKDKDWLTGVSDVFSNTQKIVKANLGRSSSQLYDAKLITTEQWNVMEGYLSVFRESDPLKASAVSADACVEVGFTKGAI